MRRSAALHRLQRIGSNVVAGMCAMRAMRGRTLNLVRPRLMLSENLVQQLRVFAYIMRHLSTLIARQTQSQVTLRRPTRAK